MHRNLDTDRRFIASLCHNRIMIYDKYHVTNVCEIGVLSH